MNALTMKLRSDMEALGFEEVPTSTPLGAVMGNRDFQRGATLIRFWGGRLAPEWVHIEHEPLGDLDEPAYEGQTLIEIINNGHGTGIAALAVYLKKGGRL
jgi:hypothetical protein